MRGRLLLIKSNFCSEHIYVELVIYFSYVSLVFSVTSQIWNDTCVPPTYFLLEQFWILYLGLLAWAGSYSTGKIPSCIIKNNMIANIWTRYHFLSKLYFGKVFEMRRWTYRPDNAWTATFVTVSRDCLSQFNKYQLRVKSPHCADLRQIDILKTNLTVTYQHDRKIPKELNWIRSFLEWSFYLEEALW